MGALTLTLILSVSSLGISQTPKSPDSQCRLTSEKPHDLKLKYVPTKINDPSFKHTNPVVAYDADEDGKLDKVNIVRSTGSRKVDSELIRSVKDWQYAPRPGCLIRVTLGLNIDLNGLR